MFDSSGAGSLLKEVSQPFNDLWLCF